MTRRMLPIGIQSFHMIREADCYYVDKTSLVRRLVDEGHYYFLSRPRRFGKSLLLDSLKSLFEGHEALFRGLDIHAHWDWSTSHPVVRLSFGGKYSDPEDLERSIIAQLTLIEHAAGFGPAQPFSSGPERLESVIFHLHRASGQRVVVLVDEYDKPILDVLHDPELAISNRDYLRGFYGKIKDCAHHVRFVFVTGVSMFSKVSLFSGLNNLKDISLDPRFASICGYTDDDIDTVFRPELDGLDREAIRNWYNGYHWRGGERVYNPYDALLLFDTREFRPYWFESGSPNFLFRMLMEKSVSPMELENRVANMSLLSTFDVNDIGIEALLFQTGYLTIADEQRDNFDTLYRLDYPNLEVKISLNRGVLQHLGKPVVEVVGQGKELCSKLEMHDFSGFAVQLRSYLSGIPYQWHATGGLARYEAWYASLLHMGFRAIGVDLQVEDASCRGSADMVVFAGGQVFVLEFKMTEEDCETEATLSAAIRQMRDRGYADKYRYRGEPIHLVALACSRAARNLLAIRAVPA